MVQWHDLDPTPTLRDLIEEFREELVERVSNGERHLEEVLFRINYCLQTKDKV